MALNIQRGRDHGLPFYNQIRAGKFTLLCVMKLAYGFVPKKNFSEITDNYEVQQKLQAIYGDVDKVEAFVGLLAESKVRLLVMTTEHLSSASNLGETAAAIVREQYLRFPK